MTRIPSLAIRRSMEHAVDLRFILGQIAEVYATSLRRFEEAQLEFLRQVLAVAANPGGATRLASLFTRDSFLEFISPVLDNYGQRDLADQVLAIFDQNAASNDLDLEDADAEGEDDLEEEEPTVPPPSRPKKSKSDKA